MSHQSHDIRSDMADRVHVAADHFYRRQGNCAQAVLHAFQNHFNISAQDIAAARRIGGGKAERGYCGALSAALRLAGDREHVVHDFFTARAGAAACREIRRARSATCVECVTIAAQAVSATIESEPGADESSASRCAR